MPLRTRRGASPPCSSELAVCTHRFSLINASLLVVALFPGIHMPSQAVPRQSPPSPTNPATLPSRSAPTSTLDEEKLRLDIRKLRQDTSAEGRTRAYIPLASALVAAAAIGFGIFQYVNTQQQQRDVRVDEGII